MRKMCYVDNDYSQYIVCITNVTGLFAESDIFASNECKFGIKHVFSFFPEDF